MECRSGRVPQDKPPLAATYMIVVAALVVVLLPTFLNLLFGHGPFLNLAP